jgi:iron complex outermembrane recepter protein
MKPNRSGLRARRLRLATAAAAIIAATSAHSQEAVLLDEIVVREGGVPGDTAGQAKAREEVARTPGGAELVRSEAYESTAATTTKDMLDYVPGVFAQPKFGEDSRLTIRGSGLSRTFHLRGVKLLVDGIPINTADGAGDFQEIDPLSLSHMQVFKGANALRYGAAMLGGVVAFETPTGRDFDSPALLRAEAGSFGFLRGQFASGKAIGDWDYYVSASWLVKDGFRDHSEQDSRRLNGNVGYRINDRIETRTFFSFNDVYQQIPGELTRTQALTDPRQADPFKAANDWRRDVESVRLANRTTIELDNGSLAIGAYGFRKHLEHPIFQYLDNVYLDWGAFVHGEQRFDHGARASVLTYGVNVGGGTTDAKRFVNVVGERGAPTYEATENLFNAEFFAEYQYRVTPELALVLGGQVAYADRRVDVAFGGASGGRDFLSFSPRLGVLYDVRPDWQVFANVSRSFEPPPLSELSTSFIPVNPADIEAQKAWTIELGTRGETDRFRWNASVYHAWVEDELQFIDLGGGMSRVENVDRTIHQGAEIGLGVALLDGVLPGGVDRLWLNGAYTWSRFVFDGNPQWGDNRIPGAPAHYLRAELLYEHPSGFFAGPNVEWVPEAYFVDNANTLKTEPYALLGFRTGLTLENGLKFFLESRNLTDEKYISSTSVTGIAAPDARLFNPGNGRSFYGGLSFKF